MKGCEWAVLAILLLVILAGYLMVDELGELARRTSALEGRATTLATELAVAQGQVQALQEQVNALPGCSCRVRVNVKNTTNVNTR
jgi:hypothetical protein